MSSPDLTIAEIKAVNQVLQTRYLSLGPRIAEFEERFAAYAGARHAIGVSNGTAGLHLCVIAAGVSEGDPSGRAPGRSLVITTPFSFVPSTKLRTSASANVILYQRAIPSRPYFTPIHLQPFYRERFGYREGDFPVTESVA